MADNIINPFGASEIRDYNKLLKEFGVNKFEKNTLPDPLLTMKRGIVFGHRDINPVLNAMRSGKKFGVISGIKPSNNLHLGSKMIIDEIVYFQNHGAIVNYAIADLEALVDNGLSLDESRKYAFDNILDLGALGINLKKSRIYLQSEEIKVQRLAYQYSRNVTNNMLKAIYGEHPIGMYMAVLTQVADILLPQIEHGIMPVVVPVGFDQDPHIRLTRDIANKNNLMPPSTIYHEFMPSLFGVNTKMSKRETNSIIYLNESPSSARKKIMKHAFTGGQVTIEEHQKLGGNPEIDVPYTYLKYFEENDKELKKVHDDYKSGKLLSGEIKTLIADKIEQFLIEHQERREKCRADAERLLK